MPYKVYHDAITKIQSLITIIQGQNLSTNTILRSMSQQLLTYIDKMIEQTKLLIYINQQPKQQQQKQPSTNHYNDKLKIKYNKLLKLTNGEIIDEKQYPQFNKTHMHEQCPICISDIFDLADQQDIIQLPCNHLFHCDCINQCINNDSLKCPIDQKIYGIIIGDQPDGTMSWKIQKNKCEGYNCDTIVIDYQFGSGKYNGGQSFSGTHRVAYLPDNPEGKEALELLKRCFNQKLTFKIGTSLTTGQQHQVVWNGIHHKTSLSGGPTRFGYPDNTYFQRLKQELSAKGIN